MSTNNVCFHKKKQQKTKKKKKQKKNSFSFRLKNGSYLELHCTCTDWLQSPVTKYFIILFDNPGL